MNKSEQLGAAKILSLGAARDEVQNGSTGILVDNSSLTLATPFLEFVERQPTDKWHDLKLRMPQLAKRPDVLATLSLIQSLIIYESLFVDGVVLETMESARSVAKSFSNAISALQPSLSERFLLADDAYRILQKLGGLVDPDGDLSSFVEKTLACDFAEASAHDFVNVGGIWQIEEGKAIDETEWRNSFFFGLRNRRFQEQLFGRSDNHVARTIYYGVLSETLGLPYAPHPLRSQLFARINKAHPDITNQVLETFTTAIDSALPKRFVGCDLTVVIPPVAQYVIATARRPGDLRERILEIRESKQAKVFRKYCGDLQAAIQRGVPARGEALRLFGELTAASKAWAEDVREEVDYRTRDIRISVGLDLFKAELKVGGNVRDPILWGGRFRTLLFLNDLVRGWEPGAP